MIAELAADHAREETFVYDLGCSTGTTMIGMNTSVDQNIRFIGIDDSQEMLDKCKSKLMELGFSALMNFDARISGKVSGLKTHQSWYYA